MAATATALFHISIWPLQSDHLGIAVEICVALSLAVYGWVAARKAPSGQLDRKTAECFTLVVFLFPLLWEAFERWCLNRGEAFEFRVAACLRNLMIACLLWPAFSRHRQFAAACSLFLILFSYVIRPNPASSMLLVLYGCLGLAWMIFFSWERIQTKMAATSQRNIPRAASVGGLIIAGLLALALVFLIPVRTLQLNLWQIFPSSGGTGKSDDFAWRGVRDGNLLVAGVDQADTFGPVDSQVFMESDQPTLYDMMNDLYGEDSRAQKNRERAIAMNQKDVQTSTPKNSVQETATREFSTLRRPSDKSARSETRPDTKSNALLYVPGDQPVHLSQQYYDKWDGQAWSFTETAEEPPPFATRTEADKTWFRWDSGLPENFANLTAELKIKILRWSGNRLPLAPLTTGISIPKLTQVDFLRWQDDGSLALNRPSIPTHTVFSLRHELCRRSDLHRIPLQQTTPSQLAGDSPRRRELLTTWTADIPAGWAQIEAIVARLHAHCQYDPSAIIPAIQTDAVDYVLFENPRATDYLYASCAAVLLRDLGYQVRLVTGFYADPKKFDSASEQISVEPADVHVWLEVAATHGAWLPVDPTPGYSVQYAPPSWSEWAFAQVANLSRSMWENRLPVLLTTLLMIILWRIRHALILGITWLWWCAWPSSNRRRLLQTWRWVECQLCWAGMPRSQTQTVRQYVRSLRETFSTNDIAVLQKLLAQYEYAVYSGATDVPGPQDDSLRLCQDSQLVIVQHCCPWVGKVWNWFAFGFLLLKVQRS